MATQVFLIDGTDSTRALMRMVLRNTAFQVAGEASTLLSAIPKIALQHVDIAVLDNDADNSSNHIGIAQLKEHYPKLVVVIASVQRDSGSVQAALQQGAAGYVIKPFTAGAFEDCLARAWRRHGKADGRAAPSAVPSEAMSK